MNAAKKLVRAMEELGVEAVFGIPGGANLPFYDALLDSEIRSYLMRHEQQAAHAAEGYARVKRRPGIASATSGPGATNLITGLVNASMDSAPLVAVTGQVTRPFMGTDAFQESDIVSMVLPHVKYATTVLRPERLSVEFANAYFCATSPRAGPTLVDVPRDVFQEEVSEELTVEPEPGFARTPPEPSEEAVSRAAELIARSRRPLILVGGGVWSSGATDEVLELSGRIVAPVVTTTPGKTSVPEDHPNVLGVVGMHGRVEANLAMVEADLVIAVGTRLSDRAIGPAGEFRKGKSLIHVDVDSSENSKVVKPDVFVQADCRAALRSLLRALRSGRSNVDPGWIPRLKGVGAAYDEYMLSQEDSGALYSWKVVKLLRDELPRSAIVTTGVGQHQMWAQLFYRVLEPGTFITSAGLGTMGFGLPAAFGAKVAAPNRVVVNLDGDGSFLMTCQTLANVAENDVPVITVIFDNRSLGMVRQWQDLFYRRRYKDVDFTDITNLVKLSEAFGVEAHFVQDYGELVSHVRRAVRSEQAVVLDVPVSRDEKVFPMVPPGRPLEETIYPPGFSPKPVVDLKGHSPK
ncbi:MAG: biosynthetic-type acetolactate synthase large subunit [Candidatus Caldarchaeales archaeon]